MRGTARLRTVGVVGLLALLAVGLVACWPRPQAQPQSQPQALKASQIVVDVDDPPVYGYRVVAEYPHDPQAFTQGLVYPPDEAGVLYESTGLYGRSSLRKVELETGRVLRIHYLEPRYFAEGLALWDDALIQLTWREGTGFVYDRETFELRRTFRYETEGWGLASDVEARRLILSDGSSTLYFLDPETFSIVGRVPVSAKGRPVRLLNELEVIRRLVWANVWQTDRIAVIDPKTGRVGAWLDLSGLLPEGARTGREDVLNGIAYDARNDRLFVTGKLWPKLFEIELVPP